MTVQADYLPIVPSVRLAAYWGTPVVKIRIFPAQPAALPGWNRLSASMQETALKPTFSVLTPRDPTRY